MFNLTYILNKTNFERQGSGEHNIQNSGHLLVGKIWGKDWEHPTKRYHGPTNVPTLELGLWAFISLLCLITYTYSTYIICMYKTLPIKMVAKKSYHHAHKRHRKRPHISPVK